MCVRRAVPHARSVRLTGRGLSAPTPARLRPWLARHPRLPAPSHSPCRVAAAAAEGLDEGHERRAAEPPAAALSPTATACIVADVVVELGPEARSGSRPSIVTDGSHPNHLASCGVLNEQVLDLDRRTSRDAR